MRLVQKITDLSLLVIIPTKYGGKVNKGRFRPINFKKWHQTQSGAHLKQFRENSEKAEGSENPSYL